jgi:hypothetical protein
MKALHQYQSRGIRLWATVEFLCFFVAFVAVLSMLYLSVLTTAAFLCTASRAQDNSFWTGYHGESSPWQWGGPDQSGEYWLNQTSDALSTMQDNFWNGTYWVSALNVNRDRAEWLTII